MVVEIIASNYADQRSDYVRLTATWQVASDIQPVGCPVLSQFGRFRGSNPLVVRNGLYIVRTNLRNPPMYQYGRRCFARFTGDSAKPVRRSAGLVLVGGLLALAGGCDKSGDATEVTSTDIGSTQAAVDIAGASTQTTTSTSKLPSSPTQTSNITNGLSLQAADPNAQSTSNLVPSGSAPIEFEPRLVDVGYILPNETKDVTFQIRNLSDEPVKITLVKPNCACTTLDDLTGTVIPPHSAIPLTAQIKARSKPSPLTTSITFLFEGYAESSDVTLSAQISRAIKTVPQTFNCASGVMSGRVVVQSIDGRPFTIFAANREPPQFIGFDPETDELRSSYVLRWTVSQYSLETLPDFWIIETDHPDCPVVDVSVRHRSNLFPPVPGRVWHMLTQHVVVDSIEHGQTAEFTVEIKKLGNDEIYSVHSLSKEFNAQLVSLEHNGDDAEATVRITPVLGHQGLLYGEIEFLSLAHHHWLTVIGTVAE